MPNLAQGTENGERSGVMFWHLFGARWGEWRVDAGEGRVVACAPELRMWMGSTLPWRGSQHLVVVPLRSSVNQDKVIAEEVTRVR